MKYLAKIIRHPPYKSYWIGEPNNFMGFEVEYRKSKARRFKCKGEAIYAVDCVRFGDEWFEIVEVDE